MNTNSQAISGKERHELFFEMEEKFGLFDIKAGDGSNAWDIIRHLAYYYIAFRHIDFNNANAKQNYFQLIGTGLKKAFYATRSIISLIKILFFKNGLYMHFGASRTMNVNGDYYDPYFDTTKKIRTKKVLFYESVIDKTGYSNDSRIFDILPTIRNLVRIIFRATQHSNLSIEEHTRLQNAFKAYFEESPLTQNDIEKILNDYRLEYRFYKWLLKWKKIQSVFLVQNGVQKALIQAAKDSGILTFEYQHGDIVESTLLYNYGPTTIDNPNIIYPDYLLTFSNTWTINKFIPSKCLEIGTNHLVYTRQITGHTNRIAVIASNEYNDILQKLTADIAAANPNLSLYYKLHPSQFVNFENQVKYFKRWPNITVVPVDQKISDLITIADNYIVIYSTVMYELLQAGKRLYIYTKFDYKAFKSYFNLPNVYLFDNYTQISKINNSSISSDTGNSVPVFFKPLNIEGLKEKVLN